MPGIWLPVRPHDPPQDMNLDQLVASVLRYGTTPDRCPMCGNNEILTIGHVGVRRTKFKCGTEVGFAFLNLGDDCHWECH